MLDLELFLTCLFQKSSQLKKEKKRVINKYFVSRVFGSTLCPLCFPKESDLSRKKEKENYAMTFTA